jgi:hypothetical protein
MQGSIITQVEEEKLRQPGYFASTLAQECLRVQIEKERVGRIEETIGPALHEEVRLTIAVGGNKVPVALRQKEPGAAWEIIDGRIQEWVGTLTPEVEKNLKSVTNFIKELFAQK